MNEFLSFLCYLLHHSPKAPCSGDSQKSQGKAWEGEQRLRSSVISTAGPNVLSLICTVLVCLLWLLLLMDFLSGMQTCYTPLFNPEVAFSSTMVGYNGMKG